MGSVVVHPGGAICLHRTKYRYVEIKTPEDNQFLERSTMEFNRFKPVSVTCENMSDENFAL
jgi:hypothetical protein